MRVVEPLFFIAVHEADVDVPLLFLRPLLRERLIGKYYCPPNVLNRLFWMILCMGKLPCFCNCVDCVFCPVNLLLRSAAAERSNILTYLAISINLFHRSAIAERKRESVALGKEAGGIRSECYFTGSNMPVGQNLLAHRPSRTISVWMSVSLSPFVTLWSFYTFNISVGRKK